MEFRSKVFAVTSALVFSTLAAGSVAVATPAGPTGAGPTPGPAAVGTLDGRALVLSKDGVALGITRDATVRTFQLTYPAGSYSGWHKHPGIVIATVISGTVKRQVGCVVSTFTANQTFTEVEPHYVSNDGDVEALLSITQIFPASAPLPPRTETNPPNCPQLSYE